MGELIDGFWKCILKKSKESEKVIEDVGKEGDKEKSDVMDVDVEWSVEKEDVFEVMSVKEIVKSVEKIVSFNKDNSVILKNDVECVVFIVIGVVVVKVYVLVIFEECEC